MDFAYSPERERLRAEVRAFLELSPRLGHASARAPRTDGEIVAFDREFQKQLFAAGYCGLSWPRECGGRGAKRIEQMVLTEETARASLCR
jgi:alkylation response protein AidB-like acyl-CoA dehydrogenase